MPGIVLTPSPERAYRRIADRNFKPTIVVSSDTVTMTETKEILNGRCFNVLKFSIIFEDSKVNLKKLSESKIKIKKDDLLCLIPFRREIPKEFIGTTTDTQSVSVPLIDSVPLVEPVQLLEHSQLFEPDTFVTSGQPYSKEYMSKINSGGKYFITLDRKLHNTLLNLFCEYKHSAQHKIIEGLNPNEISLYNYYFGDTQILFCKTFIKVKNCWFIEFDKI